MNASEYVAPNVNDVVAQHAIGWMMPGSVMPGTMEELYEDDTMIPVTALRGKERANRFLVGQATDSAWSPVPVTRDGGDTAAEAAMFRALFDQNPLPMWIYDAHSRHFLLVNEAAQQRYGFSRDQFAEMTIFDLCTPEERKRLARRFHEQDKQGKHEFAGRTGYWQHRTQEGNTFWVETFRQPITFEGRSACLVTATEVTEQVRGWEERLAYQEALMASEAAAHRNLKNLMSLIKEMSDGCFTLDAEGRFTFVNRQAERLLGRTRKQLLGVSLFEALPELVGTCFEAQYSRATESQERVVFEECLPGLKALPVEVCAVPIRPVYSVPPAGVSDGRRDIVSEQILRDAALCVILRDPAP